MIAPTALPRTETVAPSAGAAAPVSARATFAALSASVTRPATTPVTALCAARSVGRARISAPRAARPTWDNRLPGFGGPPMIAGIHEDREWGAGRKLLWSVGFGEHPKLSRTEPMSGQVSIRHATAADAEAVAALLGELGYPSTAGDVVARLARLQDFPAATVCVAEIDGVIAGVVTGHVFPAIHVSPIVAWLTSLVVGSSYQQRGVGRYLTAAIESWLAVTERPRCR